MAAHLPSPAVSGAIQGSTVWMEAGVGLGEGGGEVERSFGPLTSSLVLGVAVVVDRADSLMRLYSPTGAVTGPAMPGLVCRLFVSGARVFS